MNPKRKTVIKNIKNRKINAIYIFSINGRINQNENSMQIETTPPYTESNCLGSQFDLILRLFAVFRSDVLRVDSSFARNQMLTVAIRRVHQCVLLCRVDGRIVIESRIFVHVLIGFVGLK
jgi:hypothetical protein